MYTYAYRYMCVYTTIVIAPYAKIDGDDNNE